LVESLQNEKEKKERLVSSANFYEMGGPLRKKGPEFKREANNHRGKGRNA